MLKWRIYHRISAKTSGERFKSLAIISMKSSLGSRNNRNKISWKKLGRFSTNKSNLGLNYVKRTKKKKIISSKSFLKKLVLTLN